jgi:AraC family transcriptional regulator, regulatory protein of adaptative response / DNA-3-methyladenine glycosylase II
LITELPLAVEAPLHVTALLRFLAAHAVAGVESVDGNTYRRTLRLMRGPGLAQLTLSAAAVHLRLDLADPDDVTDAIARLRHLLDLDADPVAVDAALGAVRSVRPLVRRRPGLRAPGAADGFELAAGTIVGQQVSLAGARTVLGRLAAGYGEPVRDGWRLFPSAETIAALDPELLPMPRARGRALVGLARAVVDGQLSLELNADADDTEPALRALPGVGPWTARYVRMRVAKDTDVLLDTDLAVRKVLDRLGITAADAARCAPWRSYLSHHLWAEFVAT